MRAGRVALFILALTTIAQPALVARAAKAPAAAPVPSASRFT
jgi:hypothetical protein